jgi:hypothetical protein
MLLQRGLSLFNLTFRDSDYTSASHLAWCSTNIAYFNVENSYPNNVFCSWLYNKGEQFFVYTPQQQLIMLDELLGLIINNISQCNTLFSEVFINNFMFWKYTYSGTPRELNDIKFVALWANNDNYNELKTLIFSQCSIRNDRSIVEKLTELNIYADVLVVCDGYDDNYLSQKLRRLFNSKGEFSVSLRKFGLFNDFKQFITTCKSSFNYDEFTKIGAGWGAYLFIDSIDNTVCPYCNRSYTHSVFKNGECSGRPELDHFLPKSTLPFFAVSIYNLIPVCHTCNHFKSNAQVVDINNGNFEFNHLHPNIENDNVISTTLFKTVNEGDIIEYLLDNTNTLSQKITLTTNTTQTIKLAKSLSTYKLATITDEGSELKGFYAHHYKDIERTLDMVKRYPSIAIDSIAELIGDDKEQLQKSFIQVLISDAPHAEPLGKLKNDMLADVVDSWSS